MLDTLSHIAYKTPLTHKLNKSIYTLCWKLAEAYVTHIMPVKHRNHELQDDTIIVSLTSHPGRIDSVHLTIATLLNQRTHNLHIVLWLSSLQFPYGESSLPAPLLALKAKGLDLRFTPGDLRSHKKYFYAFQEYSNHIVITVDDDILYPPSLIDHLLQYHKQHPKCVIANRACRIIPHKPYLQWGHFTRPYGPAFDIMPTGVGGVLYPPHCYDPHIFNQEVLCSTCLSGDDLWLNFMCRLHHTPIVYTHYEHNYIAVKGSQATALHLTNLGQNKNDEQITAINAWAKQELGKSFYYAIDE